GDFAIVACAAVATENNVRLAIGGVADRPIVREFEQVSDVALAAFASELDTRDDLHATADYRRGLVRKLGRAAIDEAQACRV
ncbi:MAG: 2-furoyl-CoA dehydrogenase binding subunit, partial [Variibacter sp.]|nr:2-furoyl-CoA dehydrogenase binding subunit [Variibacter sp.]